MLLPDKDGERPADLDLRFALDCELRAEDDNKRLLTGYAAPFNVRAKIRSWSGTFEESIERGAFAESLRTNSDIFMLFEHSWDRVLARTKAGNLQLVEDDRGLRFEATLNDSPLAQQVYADVKSRNLSGMSFGFNPVKYRTERNADGSLRSVTLERVDLREVTVTARPAYVATSLNIRSLFTPPGGAPVNPLAARAKALLRANGYP